MFVNYDTTVTPHSFRHVSSESNFPCQSRVILVSRIFFFLFFFFFLKAGKKSPRRLIRKAEIRHVAEGLRAPLDRKYPNLKSPTA